MSLKDQFMADIENVFLNGDEFAEDHVIEGKTVRCVVNNDSLIPIKEGHILGQVEADLIVYGKTEDFPRSRGPESLLNVDGRELIVVKWGEAIGLTEIALKQNRTY